MKFRFGPTLLLLLVTLWGVMQMNIPVFAAGSVATVILPPVAYTTVQGSAAGEVGALAVNDQSGTLDTPSAYVLFGTPTTIYDGYFDFGLPAGVPASALKTLQVRVNYKGLPGSKQLWTLKLYNWSTAKWIVVGNTKTAKNGIWTSYAFNVKTPARFAGSAGNLRLELISNNVAGDARIDYAGLVAQYAVTPPATSTPQPSATPTATAACPSYDQTFEGQVLVLLNQERAKVGLPALKAQSQLAAAARVHSADMACKNYFSHTGSDGSTFTGRIEQQGYHWSAAAENIAAGSNTPEGVVQQWMNSAPHKANILNPTYTEVGVGYAYSSASTYKYYWTLDFGRP